MNKKLLYSAPEAELLVVKFEENIMSPNGYNDDQHTEYLGEEEDGGNL